MTIICGTDLSPASAGALDVARALANQRGDDEIVLLHVADPAGNEVVREAALDKARAALDALALSRPGTPTVRAELTTGEPDETLVSFAETEGSDLIVIAHRSANAKDKRLGSTANKIIAHTHVTVLAVRDPEPWLAFTRRERPLKVLLGVDDSAVCDLGIQWTHGLRARGPVEVVLGAIYYPDDAASHYGLSSRTVVDRDPEIEALMSRDLLRRFGAEGEDIIARPRRGLGRIGDHVVELARDEKVDAIVVGTGQKTGLGRLGSVSSIIVADATQSVICVPPQASIPTLVVPRLRSALVATDLSPFANRAVAYAFSIATEDVHIVHVLKEDADTDEAEVAQSLTALAPAGARQKVIPHVVRGDDAAITLARCAARHGVDVICISSHGRSGIKRALVGSVADQLLRATRLPVLVLRPS
jgi:nucleotide-binding universal stress UspA family protein